MDIPSSIPGSPLLMVAAVAATVAVFGIVHDYRHSRRTDLDKVSLLSWGKISSAALIVAIVCLANGLRGG